MTIKKDIDVDFENIDSYEAGVDSIDVKFAYGVEGANRAAPTEWIAFDPNDITDFGANISTTAREPLSTGRQRKKGRITNLESSVAFTADVTMSNVANFVKGFMFTKGDRHDQINLRASGTTTNSITGLSALTQSQRDKMISGAFVRVVGAGIAEESDIDTQPSTGSTTIALNTPISAVSGDLTVSIIGYGFLGSAIDEYDYAPSTDEVTIDFDGTMGTPLVTMGLVPGMLVHIGKKDANGDIENAFSDTSKTSITGVNIYGYGIVKSVANNKLVLSNPSATLKGDNGGAVDLSGSAIANNANIDILFGACYKDVEGKSDPNYERVNYQIRAQFPGLGNGTGGNKVDSFSIAEGNQVNTMQIDFTTNQFATMTYNMVGLDTKNDLQNPTEPNVDPDKRDARCALQAKSEQYATPVNTTGDFARLRLDIDKSGSGTVFESVQININNNLTPKNVLGRLGAWRINTGAFAVQVSATTIFQDPEVLTAIRENKEASFDVVQESDDGVIGVLVPKVTIGDGTLGFPRTDTANINLTNEAFVDNEGYTCAINLLPVPLGN